MALVLRPAATAIGPVLGELKHDLGLSDTQAGILTALPGIVFAVVGIVANRLVPKFGRAGALTLGAACIFVGSLLRVFTGSWTLFALFTIVALAGMAVGNVILPAFIKSAFPHSSAQMATVYTTSLAFGAFLPTLLASPLEGAGTAVIGSVKAWRVPVGIWAIIGLCALIVWILVAKSRPREAPLQSQQASISMIRLLKSPTVIALTLFFGTQSMHAYIQFGWIAQAYRDGGLNAATSALMITIIAVGGIPGGLLMPRVVKSGKLLPGAIVLFSALLAAGYLGIALAPTLCPWLWACALAVSGFCFPAALALIIERTKSSLVTSSVSGFVQPIGYLLAAIGPLLVGVSLEAVGSWQPILYVLAATSLVLCGSGLYAARPVIVEEQI